MWREWCIYNDHSPNPLPTDNGLRDDDSLEQWQAAANEHWIVVDLSDQAFGLIYRNSGRPMIWIFIREG